MKWQEEMELDRLVILAGEEMEAVAAEGNLEGEAQREGRGRVAEPAADVAAVSKMNGG